MRFYPVGSGPLREPRQEIHHGGERVPSARDRARYQHPMAPELQSATHILGVVNAGAAKHAGHRGDRLHRGYAVRDDVGPGQRDRAVAPDQLGGFDGQVRREDDRELAGVARVLGADDIGESEGLQPPRSLPDLGRCQTVLGMVEERASAPRRLYCLWYGVARPRARQHGVHVLGEHRDLEGGGEAPQVRGRRGDRHGNAGFVRRLFQEPTELERRFPEAPRVGLEVQKEQVFPERRLASGRPWPESVGVASRWRTRLRRRRLPGRGASFGAR
jgi:hypothetical protein